MWPDRTAARVRSGGGPVEAGRSGADVERIMGPPTAAAVLTAVALGAGLGALWRSWAALSLVPVAVGGFGVLAGFTGPPSARRWAGAVTWAVALLSLAATAALVAVGRPDPGTALALATFVECLALLGLVALTARHTGPVWLTGATLATVMAISWSSLRFGPPPATALALLGIGTWAVATGIAAAVGLYVAALDRQRVRSVAEAQQSQRVRLARDLHDFVAHDVSEMIAQAQAGQILAGADGSELGYLFSRIEDAGQRALRSLDETVQMLRVASGPGADATASRGLDELPALVHRFGAADRVRAELDVVAPLTLHELGELAPAPGAALYRVAVEALTNVRRHAAGATRVAVAVRLDSSGRRRTPPFVELEVTDDGVGKPDGGHEPARIHAGEGLAGLAEVLRGLGGELETGPRDDGGWFVLARVPLASGRAEGAGRPADRRRR